MKLALISSIALSLVMALFAVQNSQQTQVTFLGRYFDGPLVIILLITFGAGVLSTFLAMLPGLLHKSIEISKFKSRLADCSAKVAAFEEEQKKSASLISNEPETETVTPKFD